MGNIRKIIERLQQTNDKAYYLAFLRVALSIWFLKELLFRWPVFEILYSNNSFLNISHSLTLRFFHLNESWLRNHYQPVVYVCVLLLVLNLFGIGRNIVSFLLFIALTLLYSINNKFANSGDEMSMLLAFYLSFANTFSRFTLFKQPVYAPAKMKLYNLVSNLAAYSIMLNLCLVYFMSGLYKLQDPYWRNGTAVHYFLNDDRYSIFAFNRHISLPPVIIYIINYGTILYELSFSFTVWSGRSRNITLLTGIALHIGIYFFLMIYGMSLIFLIQYGMFYSNEEIMAAAERIKKLIRGKSKRIAAPQ